MNSSASTQVLCASITTAIVSHRQLRVSSRLARVALPVFVTMLSLGAGPTVPETHLAIDVHLTPDAHGELAYLIFASAAGFPTDPDKAIRGGFVPISVGNRSLEITTDLPPGNYAVSLYEDLNGNHRLDSSLIGIPREPVGASNNPPPRHGAPRFDECSFRVSGGIQRISITMIPNA